MSDGLGGRLGGHMANVLMDTSRILPYCNSHVNNKTSNEVDCYIDLVKHNICGIDKTVSWHEGRMYGVPAPSRPFRFP